MIEATSFFSIPMFLSFLICFFPKVIRKWIADNSPDRIMLSCHPDLKTTDQSVHLLKLSHDSAGYVQHKVSFITLCSHFEKPTPRVQELPSSSLGNGETEIQDFVEFRECFPIAKLLKLPFLSKHRLKAKRTSRSFCRKDSHKLLIRINFRCRKAKSAYM